MILSGQIGETAFIIKIRKLFVAYHNLSKVDGLLLSPHLTGLCAMESRLTDLFVDPLSYAVCSRFI